MEITDVKPQAYACGQAECPDTRSDIIVQGGSTLR